MLVVLTDRQILPTQQVCQGCLLASNGGLPRWRQGHLGCGRRLRDTSPDAPELYECQMGFRLAYLASAEQTN